MVAISNATKMTNITTADFISTYTNTVKPQTAYSPRSGLPLYNGQNVRPRKDFLYIVQDCNLRKATTSEFCTTDSQGRLIGNGN